MDPEKIKKVMKDNDINQSALAARLGVSRQAVSAWLNGSYAPSLSTVKRMSTEFNVPLAELIAD